MKTVKVAILTIFILCFQEVKSEETISEPQLNETRPQQCKQQIKCHFLHLMNEYFNETTPQIEDNVLEATKKMLETELLPTIQNETASRMDDLESVLVTQNIEKDEEIQNLKDKINALEANQNTSKVIFSGVRKNHMTINSNVRIEVDITFDEAIANIGQGLDIDTGIFKCPVSGIYTFSFGALSDLSGFYTFVGVYKNGTFHFWIHENGNGHASYVNLSHVWTMVLQKDDTVQLKLVGGGGEDKHYKGLHSQSSYPVWFNGQLLMQQ